MNQTFNKARKGLIYVFTAVIFLFGLAGCEVQRYKDNSNKEEVVPVSVCKVSKKDISNKVIYYGIVKANKEMYVIPKISGEVKEVFYEIGDKVNKGDILFAVDSEKLSDNIKLLELKLKSAQINVDIAKKALDSTKGSQFQAQKDKLEANLKSAKINYDSLKKAFDDASGLYKKGIISEQQYSQSETAFKQGEAALSSAQKAYDLFLNKISKENVENAKDRLRQAEASYEIIKMQLDSAKKELNNTKVKSPISGVISQRNINPGSMVGKSGISFSVSDIEKVKVEISVSENLINLINTGDDVEVDVESANMNSLKAKIDYISPSADKRTKLYKVCILLDNPSNKLKPGMFAKVIFYPERKNNTLIVPLRAVMSKGSLYYVFVPENGIAKLAHIKLGINDGNYVQVLEGLSLGEMIVCKGQEFLESGKKIKIVEDSDREESAE